MIDLEELVASVVTEVEGGAVLGSLDLVAVEVVGVGDGLARDRAIVDDLAQLISGVVGVAAIDESGRRSDPSDRSDGPVADGVEAVGRGPVGVVDPPQTVVVVVVVGGGLERSAVGLGSGSCDCRWRRTRSR